MTRRTLFVVAALLAATLPASARTAASAPARMIVGLHGSVPEAGSRLLGAAVIKTIPSLRAAVVAPTDPADFEARARSDRRIRSVERSGRLVPFDAPNDVLYPLQWEHQGPPGMDTERAWSVATGSRSITIAVVDTGIDDTHPDLAGRVSARAVICDSCIAGDQLGHGTSVAGVAAATADNVIGTAGVADVSLIDVEVVGVDGAAFEDVAEGIVAAADLGADIVNLSLGCDLPCYSAFVHDALVYAAGKGALPICAAGNASGGVGYPAYDAACMAVSAIDTDGSLATFSNAGSTIEISAPGVDIVAPAINGYAVIAGTSVAAPQVSGAAALVLSKSPSMSASALRTLLKATATKSALPASKGGAGWLNACKAVAAAGCDAATGLLPYTVTEPYLVPGGMPPPIPVGPVACGPIAFVASLPQAPQSANLGGACLGVFDAASKVRVEIADLHGLPVAAGYAFLHVHAFGESGVASGPICGADTLTVPDGANQLRIWVLVPPAVPACAPAAVLPGTAGEISATWLA